jgi:hypothetical protein
MLPQLSIAKHAVGKLGEAFVVEVPTAASSASSSTYVESELHDLGCSTAKVDNVSNSALAAQGVRRVIQVIVPNLNPKRFDCIDDLNQATALLTKSYRNMFARFAECTGLSEFGSGISHPTYTPFNSSDMKQSERLVKPFISSLLPPSSMNFIYIPPIETASLAHYMGPPLDALKAYLRNPVPPQLQGHIYY